MEKITFQGRMIEVVEVETEDNGKKRIFEFARRSPGVRLIIPKENRVLLSREFRSELGEYDYRLPGGKVFDSLSEYNAALEAKEDIDESAKRAAIKEAHEEVGVEVKDLVFLYKSVCGATIMWDLFYFLVKDFNEATQKLEDGEDISYEFIEKEKAKQMCLNGKIKEERSALVLFRYLNGLLNEEKSS